MERRTGEGNEVHPVRGAAQAGTPGADGAPHEVPRRRAGLALGLVLALAGLLVACGQAVAQAPANPGSVAASAPNPATTSIGGTHAPGGTMQPDQGAACTHPIAAAIQGGDSKVVIALDPETLWRPRGSEVRFTINGSGLSVQNVQACFAWSRPAAEAAGGTVPPNSSWDPNFWDYSASPLVRSIANAEGKIEYGATVPDLRSVPNWWPWRAFTSSPLRFTGLFIVPIADMQVLATVNMPGGGTLLVPVVLPVGITSVWYAVVLVLLIVAAACLFLSLIVRRSTVPGRRALLQVISTVDGVASLSQFQIMLWTLVVGAAAVYVMALSGNLIGITGGTLVLLGIAGVTTLLARVPGASAPVDQLAPGQVRAPRWSDLVVAGNGSREIDVTRVQMLAFTLISAAFVGVKVLVSYEIPAIPDGFLLLMGISNGVYVTGRRLPGTAQDRTPAAAEAADAQRRAP